MSRRLLKECFPAGLVLLFFALSACQPARITPIPIITLSADDAGVVDDSWSRYESELHGISFEYPSAYHGQLSAICPVVIVNRLDGGGEITVGSAVFLQISNEEHDSLEEYVDELLRKNEPTYKLKSREGIQIAGIETIVFELSSEDLIVGPVAVFVRDGLFYSIQYVGNPKCDIPSEGIASQDVYSRLIDSFQYLK